MVHRQIIFVTTAINPPQIYATLHILHYLHIPVKRDMQYVKSYNYKFERVIF